MNLVKVVLTCPTFPPRFLLFLVSRRRPFLPKSHDTENTLLGPLEDGDVTPDTRFTALRDAANGPLSSDLALGSELELVGTRGSEVQEAEEVLEDLNCRSRRFVAFPRLERAKGFGAGHLAVVECGLAAALVTLGIALNIQVQLNK